MVQLLREVTFLPFTSTFTLPLYFSGKHLRLVDSEEVLAEQRHIKRHRVNLVSQVPIPTGTTFENTKAIFLILKTLIAKFIPETILGAGFSTNDIT